MTNDKYKILLVEDEVNVAKLFDYNLTKNGFLCRVAKNGKEGFEAAQEFLPDLIISDIMMPEMDGYEFRKLVLNHPALKSLPFVFLTAKGTEEDILTGYDLGIEEYIIKTSSPKIVIAKINAILKSYDKGKSIAVSEISEASNTMGTKVVPESFPEFEGFDIRHWHLPFEGVPGGDFIDYIELDDNNLIIVLGDVMGKKWNAWYFAYAYAGYVRSAVRLVLQNSGEYSPATILKSINEAVYNDERISEVFTTLSIIILNRENKKLSYAGAGDLPLLYKQADSRKTEQIIADGLLLGFAKDSSYGQIDINFKKDDMFFLVTDGITETENAAQEQFGLENLESVINKIPIDANPVETIKKSISNFCQNKFGDDVSLINIKVL